MKDNVLPACYSREGKSDPRRYRFGFDVHGVLSKHPCLCELTHLLVHAGHEVHIITGKKVSASLYKELVDLNVKCTHIFSVTSEHMAMGTTIRWDKKGSPHMDKVKWDRTKADYCREHKIDFMIDDMAQYAKYFTTPVAVMKRV